MNDSQPRALPLSVTMVAFEAGLGGAAVVVGGLLGHDVRVGMGWTSEAPRSQLIAIGWGVLAAGPMLVGMSLLLRWPIGPLRSLSEITRRQVIPLFLPLSVAEKAAVAIAAGLGEELLFRGLLQAGIASWIGGEHGWWIGLAVASVLFAVCHWLNATYAVLTGLIGLYFGLLLLWTGSLWTPLVAHAVYDFVALLVLTWVEKPDTVNSYDD